MTQVPETELKDILLSNSSFGPNEISVILTKVSNDYSQYPNLKEVTEVLESQHERTPATSVRLGVCQYMIGNYESAIVTLENADGGALAYFYQGKSHFALESYDKATECFESAQKAGYNADLCQLAIAQNKRMAKDLPGAMAILDTLTLVRCLVSLLKTIVAETTKKRSSFTNEPQQYSQPTLELYSTLA
jgi:DNA-directed RNA polymerase subunit alpha